MSDQINPSNQSPKTVRIPLRINPGGMLPPPIQGTASGVAPGWLAVAGSLSQFTSVQIARGEMLHRKFFNCVQQEYGAGTFDFDSDPHQAAWINLAEMLHFAAPPEIDLKTMPMFQWLKTYGRHKPTCSTGTACDCGFAAVEAAILEVK